MYSDYYDSIAKVAETDKEVADAMALELKRQRENIELIASENLVSPQVMAAMGSVLTNKYAEGLPGNSRLLGLGHVPKISARLRSSYTGAKLISCRLHFQYCPMQSQSPCRRAPRGGRRTTAPRSAPPRHPPARPR